jgi:undecaprenyl-diphosphatase
MPLITAFFLGLIQGLTEFFPISSSAHLEIAKKLLGIGNTPLLFDLACHLGTLTTLLCFFKAEIMTILRSDKKKGLYLALALIPLLPSYFLLSYLRSYLGSPQCLGLLLMTTGGIIFTGQRIQVKKRGGMLRDIFLIGTIQSRGRLFERRLT